METGFGRATLWGTFKTDRVQADDIDVRAFVVRGDGCTGALAVADLCLLWPSTCMHIRDKIARMLKVPPENVGIFTTQNHAVPYGDDDKMFNQKLLDKAFENAVRKAECNVQPAEIAGVKMHPKPPMNLCRRLHIKGFGAFTFYYGYRAIAPGKTDLSHMLKTALSSLAKGEPYQLRGYEVKGDSATDFKVPPAPIAVKKPLYARKPDDDALQALFFRTPKGKAIGSVVRFAAHPASADAQSATYCSGDYPAYLRRRVEKVFGGTTLFLGGPCGDQCAQVGRRSVVTAKKIGERIANLAISGLRHASWKEDGIVAVSSPRAALAVRKDYPKSMQAAEKRAAELAEEIKALAAKGGSLKRIKRLSDEYEFNLYIGDRSINCWTGLDTDRLKGRTIHTPLFLLRIGQWAIAGLPGEPFGRFSSRMRKETIGDRLIVAEEANGYFVYLPTAREYMHGSYEVNAALFGPGTEHVLVKTVRKAMRGLGF